MWVLALALLAVAPRPSSEGRPLFYWGARPPLLQVQGSAAPGPEAQVVEVHAAFDRGDLVLRLTFDRPLREAVALPDGTPVSGRLRAVLYMDTDDNRRTGYQAGPDDLLTGSEQRLEVGAISVGEDPEEERPAESLLAATLVSLSPEGRRRTVWRADDQAEPGRLSRHGEWVELRLPADLVQAGPGTRLVLAQAPRPLAARLGSEAGRETKRP
ncbi:MAG TPA: hypothetical protein VJU18_14800 [Vicinamibacteria bacterium]|nr:hypothetical protein [Vicinamibacteria bacterium]